MKRWNELKQGFGFNILFPRLCLYAIVPALILIGPGGIAWLAYWSPTFVWTVLALFGSLFLLNVGANLAISRYLQLHQSATSPYQYSAEYDPFTYTPYFRVQVKDRRAFRQFIKSVRRDHKAELIWLWFWLDDLVLIPALFIGLFWLLWMGVVWLVHLFQLRQHSAPR